MGLQGRFLWLIQGVVEMGAIALTLVLTSAVYASENVGTGEQVSSLSQFTEDQPATTVADWLAQIEASIVQITNVRVEATEEGLQVVLETANGDFEVPETRVVGNALIVDIGGAAIAQAFSQANPIEGIAQVSVTNLPNNQVQVTITGTDTPPVAEVRSEAQGLVLNVAIGSEETTADEDTIEILVTGEQDEGYNPSNATTATRTDTPLRDIPQSITVVPRQVLEDRNVRTVTEALETVSGVAPGVRTYGGAPITFRIIRGFDQAGFTGAANFRNGLRDGDFYTLTPIGTVERVEVLRGPASVLFGAGEPGGIVNVITRQPLDEPYYNLAFEAGSYGVYQPSIDLSGPLTADDTLLYRFIAAYQRSGDFQGVGNARLTTIAPSIALNLGEQTDLDLYYEYSDFIADPSFLSTAAILSDGSLTPRNFLTYYPDLQSAHFTVHKFGYSLEHEFSDSLRLRNNIAINLTTDRENVATGFSLIEDRFLAPNPNRAVRQRNNYFGQIDLLGNFETGGIEHQVLVGFDYNRFDFEGDSRRSATELPLIDIRNPNYNIPIPEFIPNFRSDTDVQSYGIYLQDQITFSDNLKLLIGGRYDWITTDFADTRFPDAPAIQNDSAFSPRVGLVYQPSNTVALYTSYTRSFYPVSLFNNPRGEPFEPTRGTQYEVGVKVDFLDGRLSTTLAGYHLTRTNITTPDPANPDFSVQTGEQRSRGIELDITGEILPGWNVILAYAHTDAELTRDNTFAVGNRLPNVPRNQASLWTTYTIQQGSLEGLGFGLGLFYVDARQGDLNNSFEMRDYLRTDAALYYRRNRFNAAINFRNLFDIDVPAFAFSRAYAQRTEPFTVVGSVSWEF